MADRRASFEVFWEAYSNEFDWDEGRIKEVAWRAWNDSADALAESEREIEALRDRAKQIIEGTPTPCEPYDLGKCHAAAFIIDGSKP